MYKWLNKIWPYESCCVIYVLDVRRYHDNKKMNKASTSLPFLLSATLIMLHLLTDQESRFLEPDYGL